MYKKAFRKNYLYNPGCGGRPKRPVGSLEGKCGETFGCDTATVLCDGA